MHLLAACVSLPLTNWEAILEPWQTIILAFGGNAALLGILGFLGRKLLEKILARDTARFESDLKSRADAAIVKLTSDLQARNLEHEVRFAKLHEKRAAVIAQLYSHLAKTLREAESFLAPIQWVGEKDTRSKYREAINELIEFNRYLDEHRIYLPEETCGALDRLAQAIRALLLKPGVWFAFEDRQLTDDSVRQKSEAFKSSWEAIKGEIPAARKNLEDLFRSLLGAPA